MLKSLKWLVFNVSVHWPLNSELFEWFTLFILAAINKMGQFDAHPDYLTMTQ